MARQGYLVTFAIAPETAHTGYGYLEIGDATHDLVENQSDYVPLGTKHRLENIGTAPLILIEVQSGSYLGEDDIVRFEDDYER